MALFIPSRRIRLPKCLILVIFYVHTGIRNKICNSVSIGEYLPKVALLALLALFKAFTLVDIGLKRKSKVALLRYRLALLALLNP